MNETPVLPLSVDSVYKDYGTVKALKGVSFDVKRGEVFGLLGPNGAGKTSLISILVSLEKATSGSLKVFGHDVGREPRLAKMNTGWVPQEIINHGFFSIHEILTFHSGYYGEKNPKERIEYLMKRLDLWEHREKKVKQLSGGMKRRLMIAKALVHKPGLLLLDEPTAGVDVDLRRRLWTFVEELRSEGISILLTTHYLEEAERLCDRVAIIHKGQLRAMGKTSGLIEEWSRKKTTLRLTEPLTSLNHPDLTAGAGDQWTFLTKMSKPLGELLFDLKLPANALKDVQVEEGNLEDVFVKLTQEEQARQ
jgi:ABC-2 type transport system ATP-binding protein